MSKRPRVPSLARAARYSRPDEGRTPARPELPDHRLPGARGQRRHGSGGHNRLRRGALRARVPSARTTATRSRASSSMGYQDVFIADGGARRVFRPLWWRTYRYVRLAVDTQDAPLTIDDLRGVYTGYPFERKARFDAGLRRTAKDARRRLAHRAALRARNLHGLPVLRAAAVRGRHAHPGAGVALHDRRRAPDAQCHRAARLLAHAPRAPLTAARLPGCSSTYPASRCGGSACCTTTGCIRTIRCS